MKSKSDIQRGDLKQNIMQKIIFRFDYQGIVDMDNIISLFVNKFKGSFQDYSTTTFNFLDTELLNVNEVSENLGLPVSEILKQKIHRFTENSFGSDAVTFDIGNYNTILTIDCKKYKNIDEYREFITKYISFLIATNEYLNIKRVGIRKIGSKFYRDIKNIHNDFEKEYFNFDYSNYDYHNYRNRFEDTFLTTNPFTLINSFKTLQSGYFFDDDTKEEYEAFQVVLDFEGFLNDEIIEKINFKKNFPEILREINDVHLFNHFKISVTEKFLNENS